jgi:hypothetical protein
VTKGLCRLHPRPNLLLIETIQTLIISWTLAFFLCVFRARNFSYSYVRNNLERSISWLTQTNQLDWAWNQMGHSDWSIFVSRSTVPNYFVRTSNWSSGRRTKKIEYNPLKYNNSETIFLRIYYPVYPSPREKWKQVVVDCPCCPCSSHGDTCVELWCSNPAYCILTKLFVGEGGTVRERQPTVRRGTSGYAYSQFTSQAMLYYRLVYLFSEYIL